MSKHKGRRHGNRAIVSMLLLRQNGRCFYCRKEIWVHAGQDYHRKATLDHKTPLALGGEPFGENVVAACRLCNSWKGVLDADTFMSVLDDRRRELLAEAHRQLAETAGANREANRRQIVASERESLARLQIELREVVGEYRRNLQAAPEPLRRGAGGRQI